MASIAWIFGSIELVDTLLNFSTQWYWYVLATIFTLTINDIFIHQVCAHSKNEINTGSWIYKILVFVTSVDNTLGTLTNYCLMHKHHHMYTDQAEDLTLPKNYWHSRNLLSPWIWLENVPLKISNQEQYMSAQYKKYDYLINDPWTKFCETNRCAIAIVSWTALFFFLPVVLFKIIFMGKVLMSIYMFLAGNFGHLKIPFGYRNFDTNDNSHNNLLFYYLALGLNGSLLQNNHHGLRTHETAVARWFEIDVAWLIRKPMQTFIIKK